MPVLAVGRGEVDVALATPTAFAPLAIEGKGIATGQAFPDLCALGTMPQTDRLVLAIDGKFGIRSFDELRRKAPALRIATAPNNGVNVIGYAAQRVMARAGIPRAHHSRRCGGRLHRVRAPARRLSPICCATASAERHHPRSRSPRRGGGQLADEPSISRFLPIDDDTCLAAMQRDEQLACAPKPARPLSARRRRARSRTLGLLRFPGASRAPIMPDDVALPDRLVHVRSGARRSERIVSSPPARAQPGDLSARSRRIPQKLEGGPRSRCRLRPRDVPALSADGVARQRKPGAGDAGRGRLPGVIAHEPRGEGIHFVQEVGKRPAFELVEGRVVYRIAHGRFKRRSRAARRDARNAHPPRPRRTRRRRSG